MFDRILDAYNKVLRLNALCVVFKAQKPLFVRAFLGQQSFFRLTVALFGI